MFPIAFHPIYKHPLPEGHRFPMIKYELLPQQLLHEGTVSANAFFEPGLPDMEHILAVHQKEYVTDLINLTLDPRAVRKIGFPLSAELVERELRLSQGTIVGAEKALQTGIAFNIAGGTHHAYSNRGEAFCLLNDQAIGAQYLLDKKLAKKILIVDLDVHQGNGTAEIFRNNDSVFTFSMHGKSNYPFKKETSDLDIALHDHTDDEKYIEILQNTLPYLIEKQKPDFIFYLSGVDILASDKLGKLGCSLNGCKNRDEIVFSLCNKYQIPVQVSMGGGYSPDIKTIIEAHANTYRMAVSIY
ncbi:Histone deacetylase family protein [Flavobacterium enshiense DK69]|uniref:Deacetylase n=1 Tax=Flavobacterium enshiense DK69 TaxID=1107311 RepID=V6SCW1_9FLAO|nr:histone deacetylase [Flavobacterium enshiense]ESU24294.1 Histone deacetylase family protein [Flavobacterium enshiense DK69]KGO95334.1 deacetylase [Flavobacterium enshiense DK69]